MKIGIFGYGEIGKAIEKVYNDFDIYEIKIKDLNRNDGLEGIEVLNVCIPNVEQFVEVVSSEINNLKPKLTIIHSTISPETTKKIIELVPEEHMVVHSPIRGIHPELYSGIKTFVKYIGADNLKSEKLAEEHLKSLGINVKILSSSLTTELGKLLDTTYYGLVIAWHGEMKKFCDKYQVNFDEAAGDFNKTYNEGYKKIGKEVGRDNVVRPVLYPPLNNKIGGHCLIPNTKILKKYFDSEALDLILKYS
mgnify:CR=1 FL=1|tara:strand:- start:167 stop:913 length:747 start_codon:yes stop_codon:yes gene_type:complete